MNVKPFFFFFDFPPPPPFFSCSSPSLSPSLASLFVLYCVTSPFPWLAPGNDAPAFFCSPFTPFTLSHPRRDVLSWLAKTKNWIPSVASSNHTLIVGCVLHAGCALVVWRGMLFPVVVLKLRRTPLYSPSQTSALFSSRSTPHTSLLRPACRKE